MGDEGQTSPGDQGGKREGAAREADDIPDGPPSGLRLPQQSPLFHAQNAARYERQELIRNYEAAFNCRLVALVDVIFPEIITVFEDLIADASPDEDLHLLLDTPGGDGETAIRLARATQARCRAFTVIVPSQAKSAGTLLAMGAHNVLMGPTSDLGPVDPQFMAPDGGSLYSAKDLIAAVDHAEASIAENPESYPLHVSLLSDVNAIMVQRARSALERSGDLVKEALRSNPDRSEDDVERIAGAVKEHLIDLPKEHGAVFDAKDAAKADLPVIEADWRGDQWRLIWQLWTKYFDLHAYVAEGRYASQVFPRAP